MINELTRVTLAAKSISEIAGAKLRFNSSHFKEFVIDFNDSGKSVAEINKHLLSRSIFGGIDLSKQFPELGQCALYCVTEVTERSDIDALISALREVLA